MDREQAGSEQPVAYWTHLKCASLELRSFAVALGQGSGQCRTSSTEPATSRSCRTATPGQPPLSAPEWRRLRRNPSARCSPASAPCRAPLAGCVLLPRSASPPCRTAPPPWWSERISWQTSQADQPSRRQRRKRSARGTKCGRHAYPQVRPYLKLIKRRASSLHPPPFSLLAEFDLPACSESSQDLHCADEDNQAFLNARFNLGNDVPAPTKLLSTAGFIRPR